MVFLDGIFKGITPKTMTGVPAGTHQLRVYRSGYEEYSTSVTVLPGQTLEVPVALGVPSGPTLVPTIVPTTTPTQVPTGTGTLVITSSPTGAKVILDFSFIGYTPLTVPDVPAGPHRISIRKSMYRINSTTVMVEPGKTTTVSVTLHHIWEGINPFN
ncbi:MAG: PEGA domain-containing protein [Methanomicrobiales archaeon]|nr:PEGA domain-containing protein [Methanomicrobiales archaeon]